MHSVRVDFGVVRTCGAIPPSYRLVPPVHEVTGDYAARSAPQQNYSSALSFSSFFVNAIMLLICFFVTI